MFDTEEDSALGVAAIFPFCLWTLTSHILALIIFILKIFALIVTFFTF